MLDSVGRYWTKSNGADISVLDPGIDYRERIRHSLGHSSVTMTDRYMHGDQADIHDAVRKLEKFRSHSGHSDH